MVITLEAAQHKKNKTSSTVTDMITTTMTEMEKGILKVPPISNRPTDNNNRRSNFINYLKKLLLHELSKDAGLIYGYPRKHLFPDKTVINNLALNNTAHSDEKMTIINKLQNTKDSAHRLKLQAAWLMLFSITFNVLRSHLMPITSG